LYSLIVHIATFTCPADLDFSKAAYVLCLNAIRLVKWVGVGSPVGKEQAEADGFKDTGESTDGDGIERTFFGENLRDEL